MCLDAGRLVTRHAAVVGSTGAGKTTAVAALLQGFTRGGWGAANIVVIDPHGEYARAMGEDASVRSVLGEGERALSVPYWALPAADILRIFAGSSGGATLARRFAELVADARRAFVEQADWLLLDPAAVTSDTPVPFEIRPIWHRLDYENHETRMNKADASTVCEEDAGDADTLRPARFRPYNPAGQAPHQGPYLRSDSGAPAPWPPRPTAALLPRAAG